MTEFDLTDWLDERAPSPAAEENPRQEFAQRQRFWTPAAAIAERPANEPSLKICIARDLI